MFSCLQILEAFLWFVLITLLNVTLIILTLSVSRLLNLLLRLVAFLLFLNPQCLASISRWITASSSWKRFRSEERFSRNAETDLVCRLLLEKKKKKKIKKKSTKRKKILRNDEKDKRYSEQEMTRNSTLLLARYT